MSLQQWLARSKGYINGWGKDLNYCDIEWFALETTKIILLFLSSHPSTAFWALLLIMRASQFLLWHSCPQ